MTPRAASSPRRLARLVAEARRALPRNRARAERLLARIIGWLPGRSRRFHEIGQALAALEAPALYSALGHKSFRALLTTRRLVSPTTAAKLIRIARELPAARARSLGLPAAADLATRRRRTATPAERPQTARTLGTGEERKVLARLERRISARLRDGERSSWDVGLLFDRIARGSHHHAAGFDTLESYADARFPEHGYRTLSRYRRVALRFTRATTVRHGAQKLDLALRYIDLTPAHERPAEVPRLLIAVPGTGPVPFARATTKQLEAAIAAMTITPKAAQRLPRGAAPIVHALERALHHGARWPTRTPQLTTRIAKDDGGHVHVLVTIHDVPIASLDRFRRAIASLA